RRALVTGERPVRPVLENRQIECRRFVLHYSSSATPHARCQDAIITADPIEGHTEFTPEHELEAPEASREARLPRDQSAVARDDSHRLVSLRRDEVERAKEQQIARNQIEGHPHTRRYPGA